MDYHQTIMMQKYLAQVTNQIADVQALNPIKIIPKIQSLTNTGFENIIIQTIGNCIQHYQKERAIIKYAYIIDKLLKLPIFNQLLQNVIVQFFCEIFIFLLNQKCYNQLDQLKILRKFWLKTIHPRFLQAMRQVLITETTIDIDQYFKPIIINELKTHYQQKLKLSPQQLEFHLPKTIKTSNLIYQTKESKAQSQKNYNQNANYIITDTKPISRIFPQAQDQSFRRSQSPTITDNYSHPQNRNLYPQPYSYPHQPLTANQYPYMPIASMKNQYIQPMNRVQNFPTKKFSPSPSRSFDHRIDSKTDQRIDSRFNIQKRYHQQNYFQPPMPPITIERKEFFSENFKRERMYSEETKSSIMHQSMKKSIESTQQIKPYSQYMLNQEKQKYPTKKIHLNQNMAMNTYEKNIQKVEQKPNYMKILEMLNNDKLFKCKQCGKNIKNGNEYEKHLNEHFGQKMNLKEKKKGIKCLNYDQWTICKSHSALQFDQFYITLSNLTNEQPLQLKCKLCNQCFDIVFKQDQWILINATFCLIDLDKIPMHKTCYDELEDSSSEQYNNH